MTAPLLSDLRDARIGRDGFTGSPITNWCRGCEDYAVPSGRGRCMWCHAVIVPRVVRPAHARREHGRAEVAAVDAQIRMLRDERGLSWRQISLRVGLKASTVRYRYDRAAVQRITQRTETA